MILDPQSDDAATIYSGSDRYAVTIIDKPTPRRVLVRFDKATCTDYDRQTYVYESDETAATRLYSLRKNGRWAPVGSEFIGGHGLSIGTRSTYRDPSF